MSLFPRQQYGLFLLFLFLYLLSCSKSTPSDPGTPSPPPSEPPSQIGNWSAMAPIPQERSEHNVVALNGKIYVLGGFSTNTSQPVELYIYEPETNSWSLGTQLPEPRHHPATVAYNNHLYLIGGYSGSSFDSWVPHDNLYIYNTDTNEWSEGNPMPSARAAHAAAVTPDGRIHVVGGVGTAGMSNLDGQHYVYDIVSDTWGTAPPVPVPREHLGAAYLDGTIYVAAGRTPQSSALRTLEAFDIASEEWTTLQGAPTGRSGIAFIAFQGKLYLFGGETFGGVPATHSEAERYSPEENSWEAIRPMPTARHGLGAAVSESAIYVIGGGPVAGFSYSTINEKWEP